MKNTSKIKRELKEHIRTSSFKKIHQELQEAGLYTYASTEDVISGNEIKVSLKGEEATSMDNENISYNDYENSQNNLSNYSLAS